MRPNDKGSDKLVSQKVLRAQVEELLLSDMVHLAGKSQTQAPYSIAWSLGNFCKQYAMLLSGAGSNDPSACRTLVESISGEQGTIGAEGIYGTRGLLKVLDEKVQALSTAKRQSKPRGSAREQMLSPEPELPSKKHQTYED